MTVAIVHQARNRRSGLTLMELVLVMAILVALAGILIPLFGGLIGRAETSARATNSGEIAKAITLYEATYTRYPSDWDALTDGTTTPLTYVGGLTGATPALSVTALTANQVKALTSAGITRLQLMATTPSGTSETFNPYLDTTDRNSATGSLTLSGTPNVATLTNAGQFQLNLTDNAATSSGTYVVVGFGKRCSLIGWSNGALEAPVNFFDNAALSPNTRYSRYGVVFQVSGFNTNATSGTIIDFAHARMVRVFRFGGTLATGDDAIQSYWDDVTTGNGS